MNRIVFSPSAQSDVRRIDQQTAMRILTAVDLFAESGTGNVKKLKGETGELRLRVGEYRVRFYEVDGRLQITAVKHRREAYR